MNIVKWIIRKFEYVRSLEKEVETLQKDRIDLLNHVSQEDAQHFLNRTGWAMPGEFGWDPDGYKIKTSTSSPMGVVREVQGIPVRGVLKK